MQKLSGKLWSWFTKVVGFFTRNQTSRGAELGTAPQWELKGVLGKMLEMLAGVRKEQRGKLDDDGTNGERGGLCTREETSSSLFYRRTSG
jgi:hypothetical protein